MPILVNVDRDRELVFCTAVGPVSFEDVRSHLSLERYFEGLAYKEYIDARAAWVSFSPAEGRRIAELIRGMGQDAKLGATAVVVADDVAFEAVHMIEVLVEDVCAVKTFRDEQEARAWLAAQ